MLTTTVFLGLVSGLGFLPAGPEPPAPATPEWAVRRMVLDSDDRIRGFILLNAAEGSKDSVVPYVRYMFRTTEARGGDIFTNDYFVGLQKLDLGTCDFAWDFIDGTVLFTCPTQSPVPPLPFERSVTVHRFPAAALRHQMTGNFDIDVGHPDVLAHPASGRIPTPLTRWLQIDPIFKVYSGRVIDNDGQFRQSRDESIHGRLEQMHWDVRMADERTVELYLTVNRRLSIWRGREGRRIAADEIEADWALQRLTDILVDGPFVTIEGGRALVAAEGDHWVRVSLDDADEPGAREKGAGARAGASRPIVRLTEGEGETENQGKGDGKGDGLLVIDDRDRRTTWLATRDRLLDLEGRTIAPLRLSDDPSEPYPAILRALRTIPHDPR